MTCPGSPGPPRLRAGRGSSAASSGQARREGENGDSTDGAEAELSETGKVVRKSNAGHNDASADRAEKGKRPKIFLGEPGVQKGKV